MSTNVRVEFHILQSFAPANLNRDDTGAPKDAVFGGTRRGRVSSQSLKRATRLYMRDGGLVPEGARSYRTKRVSGMLTKMLVDAGVESERAEEVVVAALQSLGSSKSGIRIKDSKTDYLLFLGRPELDQMAAALTEFSKTVGSGKIKVSKDLTEELTKILTDKGKGAVDVALFGRMVADLPEANTDASCQVAHAISTHRVERDFDYYTAVDDLKPDDTSGADMIGTVEFNSSCYYRFSVVDLPQLTTNLGGNRALALEALASYARASAEAIPSGKQNSFAAHNPPSTILAIRRDNQPPRNLANAFEEAVNPGRDGIVKESARRLGEYWTRIDSAYGSATAAWVLDLTGEFPVDSGAERVGSLDELLEALSTSLRG